MNTQNRDVQKKTEKLLEHFRKYVDIDHTEEAGILSFFQSKTFSKKENLLVQGSTCKYHFFVLAGCLRMFFIDEKGNEQTIQFAIENWWLTDYLAFAQQGVSGFNIQAVEKTQILQISYPHQEKLLSQFPKLERYFRLIYQRAYSAALLRTKYLYTFSKEEIYHHFNERFPEFTLRVPQHLLASYLNMTPEYLSEIKKKSLS